VLTYGVICCGSEPRGSARGEWNMMELHLKTGEGNLPESGSPTRDISYSSANLDTKKVRASTARRGEWTKPSIEKKGTRLSERAHSPKRRGPLPGVLLLKKSCSMRSAEPEATKKRACRSQLA